MEKLRITLLFLCICIFNGYAQDSVLYHEIQQAKSSIEKFESVSK